MPPSTALPWPQLRGAMLPLDGSIHGQAPAILAAFAGIVLRKDWRKLTYMDLTAGSCLLPLAFAAAGARRLLVNDIAPRSTVTAEALFGDGKVDIGAVLALVDAATPRLSPHVPSFHFAADYLLAPVAQIFDRLFHAPWPRRNAAAHRYLALRWIMGFAPSATESFNILMTHDPQQLRDDQDVNWRPYLRRLARHREVLSLLAEEINAGIALARRTETRIEQADLLDLAPQIDYGSGPLLVAINPPTRGLDEYVIDDQLIHSLIANRWLPLSRHRESNEIFWTRRVRTAIRALPAGAFYMVYGGDGSMRWKQCVAVWSQRGEMLVKHRDGRGGWAIFRRT